MLPATRLAMAHQPRAGISDGAPASWPELLSDDPVGSRDLALFAFRAALASSRPLKAAIERLATAKAVNSNEIGSRFMA